MNKVVILSALVMLFLIADVSQAVDKKIYSIADGDSDPYRNYPNGNSYSMWADYGSSFGNYRRRSVLKFDTTSVTNHTLRGTVLNIWGSSGNAGNTIVDVYHYGNDSWSESYIPYASSLGNKLASVSVSRVSDISISKKYEINLNNMPYNSPNDNALSIALVASSGYGSYFITRNGVNWNNTANKKPYITFRAWGDDSITNGHFDEYFGNWATNSGGGTARIIASPYGDGDVAELTSDSSFAISQILDTPQNAFYINFDYEFQTAMGMLDVTLTNRDGTKFVVGQLSAVAASAAEYRGAASAGGMKRASFYVQDASLLYLDNVTLGLQLEGAGSQMLLDNVEFSDVPEPATLLLFGLGGMLIRKRKC